MGKVLLYAAGFWTVLGATPPSPVVAATLPAGFSETLVASGLSNATAMAFAPDGRLFVCLQDGQLRVVKNGALLAQPFVTVTVSSTGERGLLGVAFDPAFSTNQYVYLYYTATSPAVHNRISRFTANGDVGVPGSETIVLELDNLSSATNHNGGALHFGPDGKLYAAVGDNANGANAQTLTNLLGKMLRLNADGSIPTDNPFYSAASGSNRAIWALGLRNPFTFDIQPLSGRTFINDVGQNTYEEINDGIAGANYGWPDSEGPTADVNHQGPLYYYGHGSGPSSGCAVTGGAFYNPAVPQFPTALVGSYFFADLCGGWISRLDVANGNTVSTFASGISLPVDLKVGPEGTLYYLARGSGAVYRISYTEAAPVITQHPVNRTVPAGGPATFRVQSAGEQLAYQWQRNGSNIAGAASSTYAIGAVTLADTGARFRCVVSNPAGTAMSDEATLTVTPASAPIPTADLNGDGRLDLLWHHQGDGRLSGWLMNGTTLIDGTLLSPAQVPETSWKVVGAGDLDGDGHTDLVWQHIADGRVSAWLMNGLTALEGTLLSIPRVPDTDWRIRSVGDLNGDGKADLFWQHQTTGQIAVWLMNGLTVVEGTLLSPSAVTDLDWKIVGTGDFDGNGSRDLVWHHQTDGRVAIWFMNGLSQMSGSLTSPGQVPDVSWKIRAVGDLNNDGRPDLIWQHVADGRVAAWLMHGLNLIDGRLLTPSVVSDTSWHIVGPR